MAKKFNQVYKLHKETAYAGLSTALVLAASLNSAVDFTPVLAPNGVVDAGATTAEYIVQRAIRIKAHDVTTPNAKSTSNDLAALDAFSKIEWTTDGFATGSLRAIGTKTSINEQFDADNIGEVQAKVIGDSVKVEAVERVERLLDVMYNGATLKTVAGTDYFTELSDLADEIILMSDEYKHMTDREKMVIVLHPTLATKIAKEMGTAFTQEAPVYQTGLMSKFSINGIPVLVDANLNKFQGADEKARLGGFILDIEAIAFKAADETKPVSVDLGLTKYNGVFFYGIEHVVDPSRVFKFEFDATGKAAKTAKVSE